MHEPGAQPQAAAYRGADAPAELLWAQLERSLIEAAAARYRRAGRFAYHFARGKLRGDPLYRVVLEQGLLRGHERILDLGCGQGLLAAWLGAAAQLADRGLWPSSWPPPPRPARCLGIELMPREVERARRALGAEFEVEQADLCVAPLPSADAMLLIDVLHYLPADAQRAVLERVHAALPRGGVLLARVGDAAAGLRFGWSAWVDRTVMLARGRGHMRLHCRSLEAWRELLGQCGFEIRVASTSRGAAAANVLLLAQPNSPGRGETMRGADR